MSNTSPAQERRERKGVRGQGIGQLSRELSDSYRDSYRIAVGGKAARLAWSHCEGPKVHNLEVGLSLLLGGDDGFQGRGELLDSVGPHRELLEELVPRRRVVAHVIGEVGPRNSLCTCTAKVILIG